MASMIKLRLKDGVREIEIEGESRDDIESILDKYWKRSAAAGQFEEPEEETDEETPAAKKKGTRRVRKAPKDKKDAPPTDPNLEPHAVANRVKDDANFDRIQKKILHVSADYVNKAAFVLWFVDAPLTSGQIHRILQALDVRAPLSQISTALKNHRFITSGQRKSGGAPVAYRLTGRAKSDFEEWLTTDGE
jgi:hypothetical protein